MSNTILIKAHLTGYRPKRSGDCSVTFNLPAITKDDMNLLFDLQGMEGNLGFSKYEIQSDDIPKEEIDPDIKTRSHSERLRHVLFRVYMQEKGIMKQKEVDNEDYRIFYNQRMEKIINYFKDKLPNEY